MALMETAPSFLPSFLSSLLPRNKQRYKTQNPPHSCSSGWHQAAPRISFVTFLSLVGTSVFTMLCFGPYPPSSCGWQKPSWSAASEVFRQWERKGDFTVKAISAHSAFTNPEIAPWPPAPLWWKTFTSPTICGFCLQSLAVCAGHTALKEM